MPGMQIYQNIKFQAEADLRQETDVAFLHSIKKTKLRKEAMEERKRLFVSHNAPQEIINQENMWIEAFSQELKDSEKKRMLARDAKEVNKEWEDWYGRVGGYIEQMFIFQLKSLFLIP